MELPVGNVWSQYQLMHEYSLSKLLSPVPGYLSKIEVNNMNKGK